MSLTFVPLSAEMWPRPIGAKSDNYRCFPDTWRQSCPFSAPNRTVSPSTHAPATGVGSVFGISRESSDEDVGYTVQRQRSRQRHLLIAST